MGSDRKRGLSRVVIEALEERRLYSVDLAPGPEGYGGPPTVAAPGESFTPAPPFTLHNYGTSDSTSGFTIGVHLVPTQPFAANPGVATYDDPNAIALPDETFSTSVAASSTGIPIPTPVTLPSNLVPGDAYYLIMRIDPHNAITETNETNNDVNFGSFIVLTPSRVLQLSGTGGNDVIALKGDTSPNGSIFVTSINGRTYAVGFASVSGVEVRAGAGDDIVTVSGLPFPSLYIDGGDGNDRVVGGDGNETLVGGAGKDVLDGGGGNDRLNGNGGNDKLTGDAGADRIYGYDGNDYLDGGSSNDRLEGGAGNDTMLGQSGNDNFFANDNQPDQVFGGSGSDSAFTDGFDTLGSIENQLQT